MARLGLRRRLLLPAHLGQVSAQGADGVRLLQDVVIEPRAQRLDRFFRQMEMGEGDQSRAFCARVFAEPLDEFDPVDVRQIQFDEDHIWPIAPGADQAFLTAGGQVDVVAVFRQKTLHEARRSGIRVDQ